MIVLGIDPGYQITGFGIISIENSIYTHLTSGCIILKSYEKHMKLIKLYQSIQGLLDQYKPTHGAIEQVFSAKNLATTIKLGQILGVAICAMHTNINVTEYSTKIVKRVITGNGNASKDCVQEFVRKKLNIVDKIGVDASDALAVGLCHIHNILPNHD